MEYNLGRLIEAVRDKLDGEDASLEVIVKTTRRIILDGYVGQDEKESVIEATDDEEESLYSEVTDDEDEEEDPETKEDRMRETLRRMKPSNPNYQHFRTLLKDSARKRHRAHSIEEAS